MLRRFKVHTLICQGVLFLAHLAPFVVMVLLLEAQEGEVESLAAVGECRFCDSC